MSSDIEQQQSHCTQGCRSSTKAATTHAVAEKIVAQTEITGFGLVRR